VSLYQPEPVEISARIRPGEWTEDSLEGLVASYREELLRLGAPISAISVTTERDDRGGVSVVATWTKDPVVSTNDGDEVLADGSSVAPAGPATTTSPAPAAPNPAAGLKRTRTLNREDIDGLIQSKGNVITADGDRLGGIGQLYVDDATDQPSWATVMTGLFGRHETFIPLEGSRVEGSDLVVPYSKALIKDAPRVEPGGHLVPEEQDRLYQHYQLEGGLQTYSESRGMPGIDTSDTPDDAATRDHPTGPARLHPYTGTGLPRPDAPEVRGG
jgi:hypothetical protein